MPYPLLAALVRAIGHSFASAVAQPVLCSVRWNTVLSRGYGYDPARPTILNKRAPGCAAVVGSSSTTLPASLNQSDSLPMPENAAWLRRGLAIKCTCDRLKESLVQVFAASALSPASQASNESSGQSWPTAALQLRGRTRASIRPDRRQRWRTQSTYRRNSNTITIMTPTPIVTN
jgi:hypothetical protein